MTRKTYKITFLCLLTLAALLKVVTPEMNSTFAADYDENQKEAFKILNDMEMRADEARDNFWHGKYTDAIEIFKQLTSTTHPSEILYLNELGYCYLVSGDHENAMKTFKKSYRLLNSYIDQGLEKKALSNYGKEAEKIYRGDPYEQASSHLMLALLFINEGDYDNALAMLKTAIMADSDSTENLYESDFTLLYLLASKLSEMDSDNVNFEIYRKLAVRSYRSTHPDVRSKFSERLDELSLLKMTPEERKKMKVSDTDDMIKQKIQDITQEIEENSSSINAGQELGNMYTGDYNTLILIPMGKSPCKRRKGKDAQLVFFAPVSLRVQRPKIGIDGKDFNQSAIPQIGNIEFQATTRGGRRMDGILNGKAAYRATAVSLGASLNSVGSNIGGFIGLGLSLVGIAAQAAGGAISPEGDTRNWRTLPKRFEVYALNLPKGVHLFTFEQFAYFELKNRFEKLIKIGGSDDLKVVIAPPSLVAVYCEQVEKGIRLTKRDTKDKNKSKSSIIITPPLGLHQIERFINPSKGIATEACAPDARRVMRKIKKYLKKKNIPSYLVKHEDIIDNYTHQNESRIAFQLTLKDIWLQDSDTGKFYNTTYRMSLVNTMSGKTLYSKVVSANYCPKKENATKGFYGSLEKALDRFVSEPEFKQSLDRTLREMVHL